MILKLKAEDLVSIVLQESHAFDVPIFIEYRKINTLRNELRKKGISSDLGAREIETLSNVFPENIYVEDTMVKVIKTESFVSCFELHASRFTYDDAALLKELWEKIN